MLTQQKVQEELSRLYDLLEEQTREFADQAQAAAQAEVDQKKEWAISFAKGKGTVKDREAKATSQTASLLEERLLKEAVVKSAVQALLTTRTQIDVLRTLAADVRQQV